MQFNRLNGKRMRLGDDAKVPKNYTRQIEKGSRLAQFVEKTSKKKKDKV